ncbi:MAG: GntR family transcriptional regulator, partial [Pseudomonadota bacterium]
MSKNLKLIAAADALPALTDNKPARKGSVEERMYHEIYDAIMEHRLPPRTKLTEHSLC